MKINQQYQSQSSFFVFDKDLNYAKTYGKYIYNVKLNIHNTFDTSNKNHFDLFIDYIYDYIILYLFL